MCFRKRCYQTKQKRNKRTKSWISSYAACYFKCSVLGKFLTGKDVILAGEGITRAGQNF